MTLEAVEMEVANEHALEEGGVRVGTSIEDIAVIEGDAFTGEEES
jgi:hypothetical protein